MNPNLYALTITVEREGERQRVPLPTTRALAAAMQADATHPVYPAEYPLRPTTEADGALAVLPHVFDLRVPVRTDASGTTERALAGWHMPGLVSEARPFGPVDGAWPLVDQLLEIGPSTYSWDRVVYTATAPKEALRATKQLLKLAQLVGDEYEAELSERQREIERTNPTIKRITQAVVVDLARGLLSVDAHGVALSAALTQLRSLLSVATEGADVDLRPVDFDLWRSARAFDPPGPTPRGEATLGHFTHWLADLAEDGAVVVHGDRMTRLSLGDGLRAKNEASKEVLTVKAARQCAMLDAAIRAADETREAFNLDFEVFTEHNDGFCHALGFAAGKLAAIKPDKTLRPLDVEEEEQGPDDIPSRASLAVTRALSWGVLVESHGLLTALFALCDATSPAPRQAALPVKPDPRVRYPINAEKAALYGPDDLANAPAHDKIAAAIRRWDSGPVQQSLIR